uniref:GB1/RHD3-type G domain-containing protein n=1 Tax=Gopherus evgoodei TaxID=1825980 RepID=A0A8C4YGH9_9SAUR
MEPVCLVEPVPSSGALRVNPAALGLLRVLARPLHVLAIFGPCGTGKSFLMDRLVGQGEAFPRSPGIWVWCLPHPTQPDQALVLLDTEGFPQQEGDETKLSRLFLLNVLLSSVFVYNTRSEGDPQRQLDRLTYVRDLPRVVRVLDESWENSCLLSSVLPDFVWCLRDVAPDPCLDEVLEAMDHELDSALSSPQDLEDSPSSCVQRLFPCRKLFRFCSPQGDGGHGEQLSPAGQLHPMFQKQMGRFKDYALSRSPKTVVGNRAVDGVFLADFLERIVNLLSRDEPVFLTEICNGLQEGSNYSMGYPVDPMGGSPPSRAAASAAQPLVLEPKREHMVPLHASRPALPVLAKVAPSTAQPGAMEEPMCLIENSPDGELQLNQAALALLQSVRQPVVVVAIAGLYRTGKSYLMNRLASKDQGGFSLGSTIQSHTKGIWMWCLPHPHPRRAGHTLVLLDTEGLGDVEKGDTKNDVWIFALAVLLSSTLVYNSKGTIDQYAMEQLHFVSEISTHIRTKAQAQDGFEDDSQYSRFFPKFIWAVRDFTLELKLNGREVTEDDYLENALVRRKGFTKEVTQYNLPRDCLRNYFPIRKCFVFVPPVAGEEMSQLCTLPDSALHPQFLAQATRFCEYVLRESQVKTVPGGQPVTGRRTSAKGPRPSAHPVIAAAQLKRPC